MVCIAGRVLEGGFWPAGMRQNLNVTLTKLAWKEMACLLYISSLLEDEEIFENI
jgi:hypothetical protein